MGDEMICGFPGCSEYMYSDWTGETSYYQEDSGGWWNDIFGGLTSSLSLTSIVGDLGGSIFDYFGSKDDLSIAQTQVEMIQAQADAQEEIARQKTKMYLLIGGVLFFIILIIGFIIIAKKNK